MSHTSQFLQEIPDLVSSDDRKRLILASILDLESRVLLYQEMIDRYSDAHPFFLVRLAELLVLLRSGTLAVNLYRKAQDILSRAGIVDSGLNALLQTYASKVDGEVNEISSRSQRGSYYQKWKPTKEHTFPTSMPYPPSGSQDVKGRWQELVPEGSVFFDTYMTKLAIETNHVEGIFLLTQGSAQDLVLRGVSEGLVNFLPESPLQDPIKIKRILNDTLAAYASLAELYDNVEGLDKATICRIHSTFMKTCQYSPFHYTPAGKTRTETRKTVIVAGTYKIQCCPFAEVDAEVDYICKMAKQWTKSWRNPFATASWIHLILVRCHPFEDGNGRLVRLLASVPLLRHGYPPISVTLSQRADYYAAINKAYDGDHAGLIQCILKGMQETISSV